MRSLKLTQEKIASSYYHSYGIKVIITRMFAYINPRRGDIFSSAFARKIVEIERGERDVLTHGNLNSIRTLIDVRDAMRSYWIACQKCEYGIPYNIGGESVISVGAFLEKLKEQSTVPIRSMIDSKLLRPVDVTLQVPDVSRFIKASDWKPQYSLEESVDFLLNHYRGIR